VPSEYSGLLCIGDPHLASRVPGFRKDDYPQAVLNKFKWALDYALRERLLPAILGDLFHWPRDNANRLLVQLLEMFGSPVVAITGNHDCRENQLGDDDALSVLWGPPDASGFWSGPDRGVAWHHGRTHSRDRWDRMGPTSALSFRQDGILSRRPPSACDLVDASRRSLLRV